jgi:hypothetical protein
MFARGQGPFENIVSIMMPASTLSNAAQSSCRAAT